MTPQQDRFGPEQVQAPETVFGMTQERKPRRSDVTAFGAVVCGQNSTHHIFVDAKVLAKCCAIFGQPKQGLRRLTSQMAWISSGEGPFAPGVFFGLEE